MPAVTSGTVVVEASGREGGPTAVARPKKTKTIQPKTPLPLRQLVPMTFVLLNESLAGTMLMPIVGFLVAFLQGRSADDAGYYSGLLVGVFAFGQIVSASVWGSISDKYGRRFPLISGLFTSGIMMMGFGLSGSVWGCAVFRFLQGTFNGNVLVAKTMMADITDKTNQAQGFAFVSFVNAIGLLIGPLLGGLLYDPTSETSSMHFLGLDPNGIFGRRPALLPALLVFFYSMVGMTVCTLFVQESNPHAKPLPPLLRILYPCLLVPAKPFEATPMADPIEVTDDDDGKDSCESENKKKTGSSKRNGSSAGKNGSPDGVAGSDADDARETNSEHSDDSSDPLAEVSATFPVGALGPTSPLALEDTRRFDRLMEERWMRQLSSGNYSRSSSMTSLAAGSTRSRGRNSSCHGCRRKRPAAGADDDDEKDEAEKPLQASGSASINSLAHQLSTASFPKRSMTNADVTVAVRRSPVVVPQEVPTRLKAGEESLVEDESTAAAAAAAKEPVTEVAVVEVASPGDGEQGDRKGGKEDAGVDAAAVSSSGGDDGENVEAAEQKRKSFGYREAFTQPITRFMLITYMILCGSDMTVKQGFPLWAISSKEKGGLGFTSSQVSYILLFNSFPALVSNYFFGIACARYNNKLGLFRVGVTLGALFSFWISMNSYVPVRALQYIFVVICSASQQFFSTWCYGLITMLTARAAPPGKVGAAMGISQSCGAFARSIVPVITGPLFAWSISGSHVFPFNHVFIFVLASLSFVYCWQRSYSIATTNDTELHLVTGEERYGPPWLRVLIKKVRSVCPCCGSDADEDGDGVRSRQAEDVVVEN